MHPKAQLLRKPVALTRGLAILAALACFWPLPAEGQTLEVAPAQFRFLRDEPRQSYPFWINRLDCQNDARYNPEGETIIEVQPNVSPVGNYSLQVWVSRGADCTDSQIRLTQTTCWKVLDVIAQINNTVYELSPQEILAEGAEVTAETCDKQVEWSPTIYFLLFDGDELLADTQWKETQVDTKAPPPPSDITASGGDDAIFLTWGAPLEQQVIDAQGFAYYCASNGMEIVGGAMDMGGQAGATCAAGGLTPGEYAPADAACGSVGSASARSGVITAFDNPMSGTIENGATYGVGIAAMDRVGNVGVLSPLTCATPEPVIGFFERYKGAGGRAGGGFCTIDQGAARKSQLTLWALTLLVGLAALRRKRTGGSRRSA